MFLDQLSGMPLHPCMSLEQEDPDHYTEANRKMWNLTAGIHYKSYVEGLMTMIADPAYSTLDAVEKEVFNRIGLAGKDVVQLACNNGRELISLKRAGARRCLGIDISDQFLDQGRRLAEAAGEEVEFQQADLMKLGTAHDGQFDLVYITIGALGWLPDLEALLELITRLLRPGGCLFIYEMHPILNMFKSGDSLELAHSYFETQPYYEESGEDYMDPESVVRAGSYWFHHKLSDVIGGCLRHGLRITFFEEYPHDISMVFHRMEQVSARPPLCYALTVVKDRPR